MGSDFSDAVIGDLIILQNDKNSQIKTSGYLPSGLLPIIDQSSSYVCGYTNDLTKKYSKDLPVVVFGDHTLHVKFVDFDFATGADGTQILRPSKSNYSPKYLYYLIQRETQLMGSEGYKRHLKILRERVVPYTRDLPEQNKIASILTSVDEVIEKTQSQIDKLQDLKKGTMNELLTKGIGHTEFKDSELGRIPKSWVVGRVSDYSSLVTNGFVGSAAQHYRETGIPYLVSKNIRDNFIDERGLTYISKEFHEKTAKSQLRTGDLLTVQSGHVGSTSVVPQKYDGANCHALILTRIDQTLIDAEFVAYYFNSQSGRLRLSNYFVGSTIVHLNTSDLKKFTIPIPELREQKEIIQIIQSIEVQVALWEEKLHQTQSLKKSLMQDLLTGKVRVSVN